MALARSYTCGLCGMSFQNPLQLGPHVRGCKQAKTVIRFAEFDNLDIDTTPHATQIQLPTQVPTQNQFPTQTPTQTPQVPSQNQLPTQTPINMLCVRVGGGPRAVVEDVPPSSVANIIRPNPLLTRDFCPTQKLWDRHVQEVYHLCDPLFWNMFEAVKLQSTTCADNVLSTCSDILAKKSVPVTKCWPRTKRILRELIRRKLGSFWPRVSITKIIDLRSFEIPGVNTYVFHMQHTLTSRVIQV